MDIFEFTHHHKYIPYLYTIFIEYQIITITTSKSRKRTKPAQISRHISPNSQIHTKYPISLQTPQPCVRHQVPRPCWSPGLHRSAFHSKIRDIGGLYWWWRGWLVRWGQFGSSWMYWMLGGCEESGFQRGEEWGYCSRICWMEGTSSLARRLGREGRELLIQELIRSRWR